MGLISPPEIDPRQAEDAPLNRLLASLPRPMCRAIEWLLEPGRIWVRLPVAMLLMVGGVLGFLPILGFWMIPLGLILLAEDVPFVRRPTMRAIGAVQRWRDKLRRRD